MIKKLVSFLLIINLVFIFHAPSAGIHQDQGDKIIQTGKDTVSVQMKNMEQHEKNYRASEKKEELKSKPDYSSSHLSINVFLLLIYKLIYRKMN